MCKIQKGNIFLEDCYIICIKIPFMVGDKTII